MKKIQDYIDLEDRFALYGEMGYYVDPILICVAAVDSLDLNVSFKKIEEFVNNADITITAEKIKDYLSKKMNEENPGLKEKLENMNSISTKITFTGNKEEDRKKITDSMEKMQCYEVAARYYFEPYSLEYFKHYVKVLRKRCISLLNVLNSLPKKKSGTITPEEINILNELDFHVLEDGSIYFDDGNRLLDAIVYNIADLYEKVKEGNNPETYLTFKLSRHDLFKDDVWESAIYPREEIQIKDMHYAYGMGFIALSDSQKEKIEKERLDNMSYWIARDFVGDSEGEKTNPVLKKLPNENKN